MFPTWDEKVFWLPAKSEERLKNWKSAKVDTFQHLFKSGPATN